MLRSLHPNAPEQATDESLLAEYVENGTARALGVLYDRYIPMVYGVCLKVLKDRGKAEDAVMGIYEELTRKVREHQIGSFRGWLYVLARNYCLMEWRKMQRKPVDHIAPENMHKYDAVEEAEEYEFPEEDRSLEKCLAALPDLQRECVRRFYYEDQSYKEIADLILEEVGKVRSYIQNGRRNLRLCLENQQKPHTNHGI